MHFFKADNGGIKEAFRVGLFLYAIKFYVNKFSKIFLNKAYQKWAAKSSPEPLLPGLNYTQEQLFFINFGQVWCGKYKETALRKAVLANVHSLGQFRYFI